MPQALTLRPCGVFQTDSQWSVVTAKNNGRRTTDNGRAAAAAAGKVAIIVGGRIKYVDRPGARPAPATEETKPPRHKVRTPPKAKIDPRYLAAARELRDRFLEHVNDRRAALPARGGKYDVSRTLSPVEVRRTIDAGSEPMPLLGAA